MSVAQAARRFRLSPTAYRDLEAGTSWPSFDSYDRICKLFGWQQ